MANIDRVFDALEKEGLYSGRITVAGSEYRFPKEARSDLSRSKPVFTMARALRYGTLVVILMVTGYVLVNLFTGNGAETPPPALEKAADPGQVEGAGQEEAVAVDEKVAETVAPAGSGERVLAGVAFTPVNSDQYSFSYISRQLYLHQIESESADVRLMLNDLIDRIDKEATRYRLEAQVLTPRPVTRQRLLELWLDGYLEEGQIFMSAKEGALFVSKINSGYVEFDRINDWGGLTKKENVFVRIIVKEAEE